jgi:outer membrane protein assembly factor BamB
MQDQVTGLRFAEMAQRFGVGAAEYCPPDLLDAQDVFVVGDLAGVTASGTTVYAGSFDGSVYALNTATGLRRWSYPTASPVYTRPVIDHDTLYLASTNGTIYAMNAAHGPSSG